VEKDWLGSLLRQLTGKKKRPAWKKKDENKRKFAGKWGSYQKGSEHYSGKNTLNCITGETNPREKKC